MQNKQQIKHAGKKGNSSFDDLLSEAPEVSINYLHYVYSSFQISPHIFFFTIAGYEAQRKVKLN
jgi:hypothetical protein